MKECKRCLLRESAENATFEDIRSRIDKLRPEEKAVIRLAVMFRIRQAAAHRSIKPP